MTILSDTSDQKQSLGVFKILSESFFIFVGDFPKLYAIGLVGAILSYLADGMLVGFDVAAGVGEINYADPNAIGGSVLSLIITSAILGVMAGLLFMTVYDAKHRQRSAVGVHLNSVFSMIVPITVLNAAVIVFAIVGLIALIVGGLWVLAVFSMIIPVILIERRGMGALNGSAVLTKGYRWPIAGIITILWGGGLMLTYIAGSVAALLVPENAANQVVINSIVQPPVFGLFYAISGITSVLIYARLREIKEGVNVDEIAAVFE